MNVEIIPFTMRQSKTILIDIIPFREPSVITNLPSDNDTDDDMKGENKGNCTDHKNTSDDPNGKAKDHTKTSDDPNVPYNKMHNGDCDSNERITNVRKENSLSRMKQAPRIAYETEILLFPNCAVYGCGFHYCKALLKNIGDHGLAKTHKSNPEFRYLIRKYMMLMLVPSDMVQTAWDELSEQAKKTVPKLIG